MVKWSFYMLLEFICGKNLVSISRDQGKGFRSMMVAELEA